MKKFLAVLLVALVALTGCGKKDDKGGNEGATYKIGTGVVYSEKADKEQFQGNTTYVTVALEGDVVKYVYIDTAQNTIKVDAEGKLTGFEGGKTKKELGDDYNMAKFSDPKAVAEWYKQIASLEEWMTGKTVAEIKGMKTVAKDDSHPAVPDEEALKSSVTITVNAYLDAFNLAVENAVEVKNVDKIAVGSVSSADKEKIEINTNIAAYAQDKDGKIVYMFLDGMQSKAEFKDGSVVSSGINQTKKQLGTKYGMAEHSDPKAVAEWDVQTKSFEDYAVSKGLKLDEVLGLKQEEGKLADDGIKSSVTIHVAPYMQSLEQASKTLSPIK